MPVGARSEGEMEEQDRAMLEAMQAAVPLNNFIGLEYLEVASGRGVVKLPDDPKIANHIGSQLAAGMFAAGEAASGGALMGTFADLLGEMVPLAERAEIAYRKVARGPILASATLEVDKDEVVAQLRAEGRARFPIIVSLTDELDVEVATMTVHWYLKRTTPA